MKSFQGGIQGTISNWLVIGGVCLALLTGCGGGSSAPTSTSTTLSGTAMAGSFFSGQACAYQISSGAKGALLGSCATLASSAFSIDIGNYTGDVLIEIGTGATYDDEADPLDNTAGTALTSPMRTLINVGTVGGSVSLAVTPLTETAIRLAGSTLNNTTMQAAIEQVVGLLPTVNGLDLRSTPPATTTNLGMAYLQFLRAVSQMQWAAGGNAAYTGGLDAYLTSLQSQIASNSSTVAANLLTQLGSGLNSNCSVTGGALNCTVSSGGGGSTTTNCDTTQYTAGAVHAPSLVELASYAGTYTGSEGSYGPNPGDPFVASGSASLVFTGSGAASYNAASMAVTSICVDNTASVLYLIAGSAHFDLFGNGDIYGMTSGGLAVTPAAYANNGGGNGAGSFGSLSVSGGASSTGVSGSAVPTSFSPTLAPSGTALSWQDGGLAKQVTLSGNMVVFNYGGGLWSTGTVVGGLPAAGVAMDLAAGSVTFSNVSLSPSFGGSGTVTLNGTLNLSTPLTGSALTFTGTGTAEAGSGMDAPPATVSLSAAIDSYSWLSTQGVSIYVSDVHTNGLKGVQVNTPAGPVFFNNNAGAAVTIDAIGKTVTFTNLTVPGQSPTSTSLTINGTLTLP
ncbi:MAG: hypothetical protein PHH36_00035 [Sideroxydans sp.]|nr:hypothetical protein [Sideroxydans sp.]